MLNADLIPNHEIARLCQALEDPVTGKDVLATVLAENREPQAQPPAIDAAAELEAAWARDQEALLDARGALLDEVRPTGIEISDSPSWIVLVGDHSVLRYYSPAAHGAV
jgi:hypothetical protein